MEAGHNSAPAKTIPAIGVQSPIRRNSAAAVAMNWRGTDTAGGVALKSAAVE